MRRIVPLLVWASVSTPQILSDRLRARPMALIAGHLRYGTGMTRYALRQKTDSPGIPSS